MKHILSLLCACFLTLAGFGQIQRPGISTYSLFQDIAPLKMKLPNVALPTEEVSKNNEPRPFKFAENKQVDIRPNVEDWHHLPNGDRMWLLEVEITNAKSLNFFFDEFHLAQGAQMFLHNTSTGEILGAFTHLNNKKSGVFSTVPLTTNRVIIELVEPGHVKEESRIHLAQVSGGYQALNKGFGQSGGCNINVECSLGDDFEDLKRSVVLIISNGSDLCTGTLINNTLNDETPYIISAAHCNTSGNVGNWVFVFDYKSPNCTPNTDGSRSKSISGATLRSSNSAEDMLLMELSEIPPSSYNVYYAGWDRSGNIPNGSSYGIHHPRGDVMKISRNGNPLQKTAYGGAGPEIFWQVDAWTEGTTEGGSSGSGIFDSSGLYLGHLQGGQASCSNTDGADWYSRLDTEWDGTSASTRLRDWLDPTNGTITILPGHDPNNPITGLDAFMMGMSNFPATICGPEEIQGFVRFLNSGSETISDVGIEMDFNGELTTLTFSGTVLPDSVGSIPITLNYEQALNNLSFEIKTVNGGQDSNDANDTWSGTSEWFTNVRTVELHVQTDQWGSENSWKIKSANNNVIASGGPYNDQEEFFVESICVGHNVCFDLEFTDSYGDGMCCTDGEGWYALIDANGDTLVQGWNTPVGPPNTPITEVTEFCIVDGMLEMTNDNKPSLFPNPVSDGLIQIQTSEKGRAILRDIQGKVLGTTELNHGTNTWSIPFPAGMYVLEIEGNSGAHFFEKIILE